MSEVSEPVNLSLPALLCTFVLFALSISLNFKLLIDKTNLASKLSATVRSATGVSDNQGHKLSKLPQGWWTDTTLFQLERRAIFSKTWVCVSHRGRFATPGDYVSYELAGFRFFLILGKDKIVRAFHNVCRHRAFPVTPKASGSSTVLGCKYHGWSYDTKGQLTKAPQFDNVPGFDKSQNSLFEIHCKVDKYGFLHINLCGTLEAGEREIMEATKIGKPARIIPESQFVHSWECKGKFNWKVMVHDRFQSGEETPTVANIPTSGIFRAFSAYRLTPTGQLCFFPVTTAYTKTGSPFWYQVTCSPDSPQQTTLRCDIYSSKKSNSSRSEDAIKDLESHMKTSIEYYEEKFATLASSNPALDDDGYGQAMIANAMRTHLEKEKIEGREINPATVKQQRSEAFAQAEGICQKVECGSDKLDW
ncbi:Fc.00g048810.m01.CDS01 [Cosmosporella sp. VM-42]